MREAFEIAREGCGRRQAPTHTHTSHTFLPDGAKALGQVSNIDVTYINSLQQQQHNSFLGGMGEGEGG